MKVSVPFEMDMDERFGIALAETGELRLASRDECRSWIYKQMQTPRESIVGTVAKIKAQFETPMIG